jgi:hypothetical protein
MWSDTLMLAERAHLTRLLIWGASSALLATLLLLGAAMRPRATKLLTAFALQTTVWGLGEVVLALVWWRTLVPRDISGFARLERTLWFGAGLESGMVALGVAIAVIGWFLDRRYTLIGAGTAIVAQGLALLILSLRTISRLATLPVP